jgi:hypothetical protein
MLQIFVIFKLSRIKKFSQGISHSVFNFFQRFHLLLQSRSPDFMFCTNGLLKMSQSVTVFYFAGAA